MTTVKKDDLQSGSCWRRWNPHLHAPGTLRNDQFANDWDGYLAAIEDAAPIVEVLGVTDYFCLETYKSVKAHKESGRLSKVALLFPNVEFRLTIETDKQKGINLHLMFSPHDPDHVARIERALLFLSFEYQGRPYRCQLADLADLGRTHNSGLVEELAARREGANQFKVSLEQLRSMFRSDRWVADNCVVAVAASNHDGTAGLQADTSFAALRREIEGFAHVIFSSNSRTRDFWLGKTAAADVKVLDAIYGGTKPCLHGCDAHKVAETCKPAENRYCWIKGDPTFEGLRQALLEPEERVFIGEHPPSRHDASQCVARISLHKAPWVSNGEIPLNSGLVAIIGSRGSGKTALADVLAVGASDTSPIDVPSSFIYRATNPTNHLDETHIETTWGNDAKLARWMNKRTKDAGPELVRYLSQQFVERLCSSAGLAVELRREIERVVFDATEPADRCDAGSFDDLAEVFLKPIRRDRELAQDVIRQTSESVNAEAALHARIPTIRSDQETRIKKIDALKKDMQQLIPTDKEAHARRLAILEDAFSKMNGSVERLNRSKLAVGHLQQEVNNVRRTIAPQGLERLRTNFVEVGLTDEQWSDFELIFKGNVDATLLARSNGIDAEIKAIVEGNGGALDVTADPPEKWPLTVLMAERKKASDLVGLDGQKQLRYGQLQGQLATEEKAQEKSVEEMTKAAGADTRRLSLVERRKEMYVRVFQSFLDEKRVLEQLYAPLEATLKGATGSLQRLRLSVSRDIDLAKWIKAGEQLLDLRLESALRGQGSLQKYVESLILPAWRTGTAEDVGAAMQEFIKTTYSEIMKSRPTTISQEGAAAWLQQVATWLYSTDHIAMKYGVTYDGVAIEQLSPGTRGIVLLLLYLVIDEKDRRPLIIDQPEENLDPKSVFDELVPHFRAARKRRQVIIVTHNANLVVNTDADQVIVASSEPNPTGGLPTVTYRCGSIENPAIRTVVCEILEGGAQAFLDRERRYRLHRRIDTDA